MSREKKAQIIDSLQEAFSKSKIVILTGYRGLATPEMTNLRRRLQAAGSEYRVAKNTLARFAAARAGKEALIGSFVGPIGIAFGYGDITALAKALTGYISDTRTSLTITGGFLGDRLLTLDDVMTISTLPSREVLLAKVLGQMESPISALLGCLTTPMRGIVGLLQARIKQLEG